MHVCTGARNIQHRSEKKCERNERKSVPSANDTATTALIVCTNFSEPPKRVSWFGGKMCTRSILLLRLPQLAFCMFDTIRNQATDWNRMSVCI